MSEGSMEKPASANTTEGVILFGVVENTLPFTVW